uniref:Uncharacterized protein n=1 Tax=Trypanosoma vivax (strain Y486) TaxID=1055687 RepID=G0U1S4_TRYVY|nr:conserved hypothetical protein [Trypanosoma vivax Y486]
MPADEGSVDDPHVLKCIMDTAQPTPATFGSATDACASAWSSALNGVAQSIAKKERNRLVQLQLEHQSSWDVAAERKLVLPELRTVAPSCTKAADAGSKNYGGTIIECVGYNTIVGVIPTAEIINHIEDNDELCSSFRPYRIDASQAERLASKTTESAPHPDDARRLEPTLISLRASKLVDGEAIPKEIIGEQWAMTSLFAVDVMTEGELLPSIPRTTPGQQLSAKALKNNVETGTSSFVGTQRFKERRQLPGVRHPELGHYHLRFTQVEPRVVGGYITPQQEYVPRKEPPKDPSTVSVSHETMEKVVASQSVVMGMAESVRDFGYSVTVRPKTNNIVVRPRAPPSTQGSYMFVSKTPRMPQPNVSSAKDIDYFPYPDVRSTVKRSRCPARFDRTFTERRREAVAAAAAVGMYNVVGDISKDARRTVSMSRRSDRDKHWMSSTQPYTSVPDFVDVDRAIKAVRPRVREVRLAAKLSEEESKMRESMKKSEDTTVSIEREQNYPRSIFDKCDAPRVRQFDKMMGRSSSVPAKLIEPPENVNLALVTKRAPVVHINPSAPGHVPLHHPHPTEIGEVPNWKWVRPKTDRAANINTASLPPALCPVIHDLCYDTSKRALVEPRVVGDPMIEVRVSRDKRAKLFNTAGCGAHVVYNRTFHRSTSLFHCLNGR